MKRLLLVILLILGTSAYAQSAFEPYPAWDNSSFDSKKHNPPPVPEPSTYGAIFMAASISFLYIRRKMKK